jgi:hypothetical protein
VRTSEAAPRVPRLTVVPRLISPPKTYSTEATITTLRV